MTRRLRIVIASAVVLVGLLLIVVLSFVGVTHTGFGQDRVRRMVGTMLEGRVKGKVYIGHMSGGFFNGVTIDSVEIRDDEDSVFFASGPVRVEYDPRDLFDRRILLSYLEARRPFVHLRQHENGDWNWRRIFPEGVQEQKRNERGFGQYIAVDSSVIHDASVTLTLPWHPPDSLRGAKLDSAIRYELNRPDHVEIRRTREGFARTWRWTQMQANLGFARIADPDTVGRLVRIRKMSFAESDPPFKFRNVSGTALHLGDSIFVDSDHWDLPRSTGSGKGSVVWGSNLPVRYYVHVVGDSVSLSDVAWVYPTLPTTGGGKLNLDIRSQRNPRFMDYVLTNMDVKTTSSRLMGQMTFETGGPILVVKNVDLEAMPVDFDLLRTFNGKEFPYDWQGKFTGHVKAPGGPLNRFRVDQSSLIFEDAHVPGAITEIAGEGELDILYPAFTAFRNFNVDVATLDLRTLQYLNPLFPKLKGTVSGTATLDSSWLDVRFRNADLQHHDGARPVSRVTGNGRVTWGELLAYDLALQAQPLSFTALSHSYPLMPLRGSYSGPVQVKGTSPNLLVTTTLTGPAGTFGYSGLVDADPAVYGARGRATTTALDLRTLVDKSTLPQTQLTGQYDLDLRGESLATLTGSAVASIERSTLAGTRVDPSVARLRFANGVATVDTLALNAAGLRAYASGTFGLTGAHSGSLKFTAILDSLSRLRALVPGLATTATLDSLRGRGQLTGELTGSAEHLALNGIIGATNVRLGRRSVQSVRGTILLADITKAMTGSLIFGADTVALGPVGFHSMRASVALASPTSSQFSASLLSESGVHTDLAGNITRSRDTTVLRLDSAAVMVDAENRYRLQSPSRVVFSKGFLSLDSLLLQHSSRAKLLVQNVRVSGDSIRGHILTDSVDLRLFRAFVPGLVAARGAIVAEVDIRGSLKQPRLFGQISLADGSAVFSNLGTSFSHILANIALSGDTVHIKQLSAETNRERRGSLNVQGTVSFEHYDNPSFSLLANASNFRAIDKPGLAALDISTPSPVTLTGSTQDAVMRGTMRVERGTIYIPDVVTKQIIDLEDPEFQSAVDTLLSPNREVMPRAPKAVARNLRLENVAVDIGPDVWLRSSEANIKLGGSLNVTMAPLNPGEPPRLALEGELSADRGTYRLNIVDPFIQPTFDVQTGTLRFFGTSDLNPWLDIRAIHTVRQPRDRSANGRDVRVEVAITGTLSRPQLALRNPDNLPLSESDLLSYLVTGEPAIGLDNTGDQVAGLGLRAVGNLLVNALPSNVLDIVELQTATFGNDPATTNPSYYSLLNTRAILGKQIGSRWFLGLSTGLCFVNPGAFKENLGLQLEYRISSLYSAQAAIEPGSSDSRCARGATPSVQPTQTPSQVGFDFFRNWRF